MKIAFCSLPLSTGHKVRGVGAYTKNLLESLKTNQDIEIQEFADISEVQSADIVHYPFFDLFQRSLPIFNRFPTIVTIHDVTPLVFAEHYPPGIKGLINLLWQKLALKNIKAIITDSQASKIDIAKYLNIGLNKIFVVPLASSSQFQPIKDFKLLSNIKTKYSLPDRFVLYTGNINWNKNLLNLAQACEEAEVDLVLAGSGFEQKDNLNHPELSSYKEFLDRFGKDPDKHILGFIPTEDLVVIMNLAQVLLLPSFYEGFGLPILEAQSCGTPVITSKVSSMPEVGGEGVLLVDPNSTSEISQAIKTLTTNSNLAQTQINKGFENVKKFSWEKCARETAEVYKKVATGD